jgi:hypothetical protein
MTCTPSHFARNLARTLSILGLLAAFGLLFPGLGTVDPAAAQGVTVSGTVRYQGQPVGDVSIVIVWDGGARELVTSADGTFRAQDVSSGGWVNIHVRPNPEQRLAYRNWRIEPVTGDVVKDFDLQSGYRLSGEIRQPDGSPYTHGMWLGMVGAETSPPENEWTGDGLREDGRFDMVLVPDVYTFGYEPTLRPLALPETPIDLRSGDVTGLVVTLQTALQAEGIPTDPPR